MKGAARNRLAIILALVALGAGQAAWSQVQPIPELPITGNGTFGVGYAGSSGSGSAGGQSAAGTNSVFVLTDATVDGFYHDPRFLRFTLTPNFHWSHDSEVTQALNNQNEGMGASVQFLSSSSTPVYFQYNLIRISTANLAGGSVPISVAATGLSQTFSLSTTLHHLTWPTLSFNVSKGESHSNVEGVNLPENTASNFNYGVSSSYSLLGFRLNGGYTHSSIEQSTPDLLNLGVPQNSQLQQGTETASVQRNLPWHSNLDLHYSHSDEDTVLSGINLQQTYDTANGFFYSTPTPRLSVSASASYNSNVSGELLAQVLSGSVTNAPTPVQTTGRELSLGASASYVLGHGFQALANAEQTQSHGAGVEVTFDSAGGGLGYTRMLFRGRFSASYSPEYYTIRQTQAGSPNLTSSGLLNNGTATYARRVGRWFATANFNYSRMSAYEQFINPVASQSLMGTATASTRLAHEWNLTAGMTLTDASYAGINGRLAASVYGSLANRTWTFTLQDNFGHGYTVASPLGLQPITTPTILVLQTYYSTSQGVSGTVNYNRRRLTITGTVTDSFADVATPTGPVNTGNLNLEATLTYKFRRLDCRAGFRRWNQSASTNGGLNLGVQSYYFEVFRRFHLF